MGFCHVFSMALSAANLPTADVTLSCNVLISKRCAGTQKGLLAFAPVFLDDAVEIAEKLVLRNRHPPLESLRLTRFLKFVNAVYLGIRYISFRN